MRWLLAVTILLPLVIAACSSSDPADQERANVDVVRRLYTEVWSSGDVSVLDEIIGDGYVKHWAAYPPTVGRDELKTHVTRLRNSFPDWNERIDAIHASGDMVFVRWIESGTFLEDLLEVPATNGRVSVGGMGWIRLSEGKIVEEWTMVDNWGMQRQLGAVYPDEWLGPGWK